MTTARMIIAWPHQPLCRDVLNEMCGPVALSPHLHFITNHTKHHVHSLASHLPELRCCVPRDDLALPVVGGVGRSDDDCDHTNADWPWLKTREREDRGVAQPLRR